MFEIEIKVTNLVIIYQSLYFVFNSYFSVGKKRKSSPAKSPMASQKQKLTQCDDSTRVR